MCSCRSCRCCNLRFMCVCRNNFLCSLECDHAEDVVYSASCLAFTDVLRSSVIVSKVVVCRTLVLLYHDKFIVVDSLLGVLRSALIGSVSVLVVVGFRGG